MSARWFPALAVLCAAAGTIHADSPPQWRLKEKDRLRIEWRCLKNCLGSRMGAEFRSQQEITALFQVTVLAVRTDGGMVLEQKVESVKDEARGGRPDLLPGVLEGTTFRVSLDAAMNVTRVEGADPVVRRVAGTAEGPQASLLRDAVESVARGWIQDVFFPLPAQASGPWTQRTEALLPGFGRMVRDKTFTADGPATLEGKRLTRLKVRAAQRLLPADHDEAATAIKHARATLHAASFKGTLHFDAAAGRLQESETRCFTRMSTSFELQGRTFEAEGSQDEITSVRLLPEAACAPAPPAPAVDEAHLPKELTSSVGMKLVLIPRGKFVMGSPATEEDRTEPEEAHEVEITRPFYLGAHEVTIGQYRRFVRATGYRTESERSGRGCSGFNNRTGKMESSTDYSWQNPGWEHSDEHPAVHLSWNDAQAFCAWLGKTERRPYRLPTEAEWEYACRAGTRTRYHSGDDAETLAEVGNVTDASAKKLFPAWQTIRADDGYAFTAPVGHFRPNAFGLYDMHGNALEWCADWYWRYDREARKDPKGPPAGTERVQRGGSWADFPYQCRSAGRTSFRPDAWCPSSGFRVALSADASVPAPAPAEGNPRAVIARAVEAMGGAEKLAGADSFVFKCKVRVYLPGRTQCCTRTLAARSPDCFREEVAMDAGGTTARSLRIVNGRHSYWKVLDQVVRDSEAVPNLDKQSRYVDRLLTLLPLLKGEVKATWAGEAEARGRKAAALDVSSAGYPDVTLFFDRETGLPCKLDRHTGQAGTGGDIEEVLLDDYREAGGIKYPARRTSRSHGVTIAEIEISEYTPGAAHGADTFAMPPARGE